MYKNFNEISQHPQIYYHVTVDWNDLEHIINRYIETHKLQLCPDFQRGHVWTSEQKEAYIEYILMNGSSGKNVYFNHPGWMSSFDGEFVLIDGLQRINAVLDFINNKVKAFGQYRNEYTNKYILSHACFDFHISKVQTRKEVLRWYLLMNTGGTPHSKEEIDKVKSLFEKA
jgi:hypothetical protein